MVIFQVEKDILASFFRNSQYEKRQGANYKDPQVFLMNFVQVIGSFP